MILFLHSVLDVKVQVGSFNDEEALEGASTVIVKSCKPSVRALESILTLLPPVEGQLEGGVAPEVVHQRNVHLGIKEDDGDC